MRSKSDDTYYLDHLYNGEKNDSGSIFVISYVSDKVEDNQNIALFGHNMQNGTMFNKITEILRHEEAFFGVKGKDNYYTDITVFTYDGIYKFDVFAAYTTKSSNNYCQAYFNGDDDFVSFCDRIQDDSKWSKDYTFVPSDVILTFSTCTNNLIGDDRIAVHALLVSISQ
jgi:sortase B